jgi:hypothetical protein
MTQPISVTQLEQWQQLIETAGVDAAEQVYTEFYDMGYNYAGWANGVATGDLISGQAALEFIESTAAENGTVLTPEQIDVWRLRRKCRQVNEESLSFSWRHCLGTEVKVFVSADTSASYPSVKKCLYSKFAVQ